MHINLIAPRNPTQVPPGVSDDIGKHDESEFDEYGEDEDFGDDADEEPSDLDDD